MEIYFSKNKCLFRKGNNLPFKSQNLSYLSKFISIMISAKTSWTWSTWLLSSPTSSPSPPSWPRRYVTHFRDTQYLNKILGYYLHMSCTFIKAFSPDCSMSCSIEIKKTSKKISNVFLLIRMISYNLICFFLQIKCYIKLQFICKLI